jgi:hypothetical protein
MLNDLIASGMTIERVDEPEEALAAGRDTEAVFPQNRHRPSVLVVRSVKGNPKGPLEAANFRELRHYEVQSARPPRS